MKTTYFILCLMIFKLTPLWGAVSVEEAKRLFLEVRETQVSQFSIDLKIDKNIEKAPGAFAKWKKKNQKGLITLTQTLLDLPMMTPGALSLFLCHELGHFHGGEPYVTSRRSAPTIFTFSNPFEDLSVEGQADFYATRFCLPRLLDRQFPSASQEHRYIESLKRIENTTAIYEYINRNYFNVSEEWSTEEYDPSRVGETLSRAGAYPSLQCRFDTMVAGLDILANEAPATRPRCWYHP